ncbi:YjbF family lipoprotein [uncultured Sulfitobacter sp.]|uniref:YjbF family lipoprotein n=1 Tax=uncultured Sulfitobacter sp. TaxID=191468 RepID=UPI0026039445|nr:YjbF family lipoprotein [uncultured Sulfitobacter sp.]
MIKEISRLVCVGLMGLVLVGCSSEQGTGTNTPKLVLDSLSQVIAARRAGPPQKLELTAAQLAEIDQPLLQINPELLGGSSFLGRATTRRDSGLGTVEVWNSTDNARVFLRNGVIIGTRGVGGDMISADANVTIKALSAGADRSGVRTYVVSDGDVTTTEYRFQCKLDVIGQERITIVNQTFNTNYIREDCVGGVRGDAVLRNEYWVQPSTGLVRKSRQWIGPRVGYFEVVLVKN